MSLALITYPNQSNVSLQIGSLYNSVGQVVSLNPVAFAQATGDGTGISMSITTGGAGVNIPVTAFDNHASAQNVTVDLTNASSIFTLQVAGTYQIAYHVNIQPSAALTANAKLQVLFGDTFGLENGGYSFVSFYNGADTTIQQTVSCSFLATVGAGTIIATPIIKVISGQVGSITFTVAFTALSVALVN